MKTILLSVTVLVTTLLITRNEDGTRDVLPTNASLLLDYQLKLSPWRIAQQRSINDPILERLGQSSQITPSSPNPVQESNDWATDPTLSGYLESLKQVRVRYMNN